MMKFRRRSRTPSKYVFYALHLYFSGLSLRKASECLLPFIKRNHVSIWNWIQRHKPIEIWKKDGISGKWKKTDKLRDKQAPQILFIERCIQLLKPKGRLGIILPESLFGNYYYARRVFKRSSNFSLIHFLNFVIR